MVLPHRTSGMSRARPETAVISTAVEVFLKDMDKEQIKKLLGEEEKNLREIATMTNASARFHERTLLVVLSGELSCVKNAHQALQRRINKIKEGGVFDPSRFLLLEKELGTVLAFEPAGKNKSWRLQPLRKETLDGEDDIDNPQIMDKISEGLLRKIAFLSKNKNFGIKMNMSLGTSSFTKYYTSDLEMEDLNLGRRGFHEFIDSKDILCHFDLAHDEGTLTKIEQALYSLGYQKSQSPKTRIYISHREVDEQKAAEVVWVAKLKEQQSTNVPKGHMGLLDVRLNEACTCLITTHNLANLLECHAEFVIYQKETPSRILLHSRRLAHNFRYREDGTSLICSKEPLTNPYARVHVSTAYTKGDMKFIVTKVRESRSLVETTELSVKSTNLKAVIRSALAGETVRSSQMTAALKVYFDSVKRIRVSYLGKDRAIQRVPVSNGDLKTAGESRPKTPLNASAPPFRPISFRSTSEKALKSMQTLNLNAPEFIPGRAFMTTETRKLTIMIPSKETFEEAGCAPLSRHAISENTKGTLDLTTAMGAANSAKFIANSDPLKLTSADNSLIPPILTTAPNLPSNFAAQLEGKVEKKDGQIPPPNTPATPSGHRNPASTPVKPVSSMDYSVGIHEDEDDDLCGVLRPPKLILTPSKIRVDLLGSIDENLEEEVTKEEEDLICMSFDPVVTEDEDLLLIY